MGSDAVSAHKIHKLKTNFHAIVSVDGNFVVVNLVVCTYRGFCGFFLSVSPVEDDVEKIFLLFFIMQHHNLPYLIVFCLFVCVMVDYYYYFLLFIMCSFFYSGFNINFIIQFFLLVLLDCCCCCWLLNLLVGVFI
jgi:hypothetical protein